MTKKKSHKNSRPPLRMTSSVEPKNAENIFTSLARESHLHSVLIHFVLNCFNYTYIFLYFLIDFLFFLSHLSSFSLPPFKITSMNKPYILTSITLIFFSILIGWRVWRSWHLQTSHLLSDEVGMTCMHHYYIWPIYPF
eukprot:TRINITY_DN4817_c0_g4_i2.p1 TRINITY_DN4817_c0_g4~~TRINITY_DN4817_c0_g4_i2.p1  ORF type:complete len:138 (+),score=8.49 TRINITY_DN4817_c0_g4_i2:92-505(+)